MRITELFERFNGKRILVIGDVMIDAYVRGTVSRVSPEAPVPIVSLDKEEKRLGGAANVAVNLLALGASPVICSVVGDDVSGRLLRDLLHSASISSDGLIHSTSRITTVKTRVIGNNQHLLRIDAEVTDAITEQEENALIECVENLLKSGVDGIIFEDYNKGLLTQRCISEIIRLAKEYGVKTTVDPKKDNFLSYKGVTLFKPNLKELKEGLGVHFSFSTSDGQFEAAVNCLENELKNEISLVTLSEHGVYIQAKGEGHHIPAHIRNIADVSGAGDTVISVATLCLVSDFPIKLIAEVSNIAGGLVCEESGVVAINKTQLLNECRDLLADSIV
jgi:rfaE bifunctional protein kinase chain/domain